MVCESRRKTQRDMWPNFVVPLYVKAEYFTTFKTTLRSLQGSIYCSSFQGSLLQAFKFAHKCSWTLGFGRFDLVNGHHVPFLETDVVWKEMILPSNQIAERKHATCTNSEHLNTHYELFILFNSLFSLTYCFPVQGRNFGELHILSQCSITKTP